MQRFIAWLLDTAIQVLYFLFYVHYIDDFMPYQLQTAAAILFLLIPLALYHFVFEWLNKGQSPGKMALGIRVINMNGGQPSVSQLLLRLAFRSLTILPLLLGLLFSALGDADFILLMSLLFCVLATLAVLYFTSPLGQRLGDRLAGTLVIEKSAKADFSATIYQEVAGTGYQPLYPEVMRLTDRDINGIRNLLGKNRPNRDTLRYMERIASRIEEVLALQRQEPSAFEFLQRLLQDYNYLSIK